MYLHENRISGVMLSVLTSSVVDHGLEPAVVSNQTIKLVFATFPPSMQLAHVSEWSDMSTCG